MCLQLNAQNTLNKYKVGKKEYRERDRNRIRNESLPNVYRSNFNWMNCCRIPIQSIEWLIKINSNIFIQKQRTTPEKQRPNPKPIQSTITYLKWLMMKTWIDTMRHSNSSNAINNNSIRKESKRNDWEDDKKKCSQQIVNVNLFGRFTLSFIYWLSPNVLTNPKWKMLSHILTTEQKRRQIQNIVWIFSR